MVRSRASILTIIASLLLLALSAVALHERSAWQYIQREDFTLGEPVSSFDPIADRLQASRSPILKEIGRDHLRAHRSELAFAAEIRARHASRAPLGWKGVVAADDAYARAQMAARKVAQRRMVDVAAQLGASPSAATVAAVRTSARYRTGLEEARAAAAAVNRAAARANDVTVPGILARWERIPRDANQPFQPWEPTATPRRAR